MRAILAWLLVLSVPCTCWAELAADEVAIIAMAASHHSRYLAKYYASARKIPESNIYLLKGSPGLVMSRAEWEEAARPEIRNWLSQTGLESKIRCLVTCWDVPLKIGRRSDESPVAVARKAYLTRAREACLNRFAAVVGALDSIGPGAVPINPAAYDSGTSIQQLAADFDSAAKAAQQRMQAIQSDAEKKQAAAAFEKIVLATGGTAAVLNLVARQSDKTALPAEATRRAELAKAQLQGLQQGLQALGWIPDSAARDAQILNLLQQTSGLIGAIRWIDQQQQLLEKNETHASFDSELSMLLWPDYPLFRWTQNLSHYAFDGLPGKRPTLMVSRLAAPQLELAVKLIDTAIATEKTGLTGKVYLDARGLSYDPKQAKPGSYAQYDQSLRDLAQRLEEHTELEIVLNDQPELFQPGECPEAALYCGWYSLAKYVDAFDWRPGAVGYHIASGEATRLRVPGNKVWCNAMLEDGICATLGPVAEPYLAAFPLPDDFFPLLLTGRYTLVETYYRTKPFNSWQMVLVGDPLYNPFKNRPLLDEADLSERMKPKKP